MVRGGDLKAIPGEGRPVPGAFLQFVLPYHRSKHWPSCTPRSPFVFLTELSRKVSSMFGEILCTFGVSKFKLPCILQSYLDSIGAQTSTNKLLMPFYLSTLPKCASILPADFTRGDVALKYVKRGFALLSRHALTLLLVPVAASALVSLPPPICGRKGVWHACRRKWDDAALASCL